MGDKKIPRPDNILLLSIPVDKISPDGRLKNPNYGDISEELFRRKIAEYTAEVVKYTLEQAAKNAECIDVGDYGQEGAIELWEVDKQSILSLEQQIIKDLFAHNYNKP